MAIHSRLGFCAGFTSPDVVCASKSQPAQSLVEFWQVTHCKQLVRKLNVQLSVCLSRRAKGMKTGAFLGYNSFGGDF
jgi:hypothetical protein